MRIVEEIDIPTHLRNARAIKNWMEKNNTTKIPSSRSKDEKEKTLGIALNSIKQGLIKPYTKLETEEEIEEYKKEHPELEEVMEIVQWIENRKRTKTAQDLGQASYDATTVGCDEKQEFMEELEKAIEERGTQDNGEIC